MKTFIILCLFVRQLECKRFNCVIKKIRIQSNQTASGKFILINSDGDWAIFGEFLKYFRFLDIIKSKPFETALWCQNPQNPVFRYLPLSRGETHAEHHR